MASKAAAVGSAAWVAAEKENVLQLLQQEKDEIIFPVQHEVEWLNEHMAEIFSRSHVDVANVFKTPGKLRGKTPRTARKRNAGEARIPLSDVFSSRPLPRESPEKQQNHNRLPARFNIASDVIETREPIPKSQTDSGYHGSSQDDIDIDQLGPDSPILSPVAIQERSVDETDQERAAMETGPPNDTDARSTEGSFHSAKEDQTMKTVAMEMPWKDRFVEDADERQSRGVQQDGDSTIHGPARDHPPLQHDFDDIGSPSDESTPDRPLVRKGSLNFASLPAREPLKTSIGARISRTSHVEQGRMQAPNNRASYIARPPPQSAPSGATAVAAAGEDVEMDDDDGVENLAHENSDDEAHPARQYSKSSTQRLHEKIDMLGKAPPPRPSKSIPSAVTFNPSAQQSDMSVQRGHKSERQETAAVVDDGDYDDDDWIKPLKKTPDGLQRPMPIMSHAMETITQSAEDADDSDDGQEFDLRAPELIAYEERMKTPARMSPSPEKVMAGFGHGKSASTVTLVSAGKAAMAPGVSPAKSVSVSNPAFPTTTPQGSPRRYLDGPLSASKSKLQSIMKSAKGLFTSSAGVSAAAKLETLPDNGQKVTSAMPGMYPSLGGVIIDDKPLPASPPKESRKTRSSTERDREEKRREKEAQIKRKMDDQLEKAREKEKQKITEQRRAPESAAGNKVVQQPRISPRRMGEAQKRSETVETPVSSLQASKTGRPVRPGKEAASKPKPAPVSIRVGTLSQRMPLNSATASGAPETLPAEPKRPGLTKKASTASLQSTNSTTFKASVNAQSAKPRALLAAERKKEQDEREAQRKQEQRREMERKRAAQQEEARKQEQKQRAEAERKERERLAVEQARRQAQQQAIERKRQETARKAEQQRLDRVAAANENTTTARPPSRLGGQSAGRPLINHPLPTNPAKPAKRPLDEDSGAGARPQASKYGAASQPADTKRRRTGEESMIEAVPRPTMSGAPIRQSNLGKKPSFFNHSTYPQAPPPPYLNQFPVPPSRPIHSQMAPHATAPKTPFAEASNPPVHAKAPIPVVPQMTIQAVKSSPQYANGDAIHLPEILTDSEDEDEDDRGNAFPIPDWATPGHLTEQLIRQEGIDGDAVFGPIAPLRMEEIFTTKGSKDRLKRLRDRTSSANWALSGDGLTVEEIQADREQRQRMRLEGGWKYGT